MSMPAWPNDFCLHLCVCMCKSLRLCNVCVHSCVYMSLFPWLRSLGVYLCLCPLRLVSVCLHVWAPLCLATWVCSCESTGLCPLGFASGVCICAPMCLCSLSFAPWVFPCVSVCLRPLVLARWVCICVFTCLRPLGLAICMRNLELRRPLFSWLQDLIDVSDPRSHAGAHDLDKAIAASDARLRQSRL